MKKSLLAFAVLSAACGLAFAEDPDPSGQFALQIVSTRTRADVAAEAVAAIEAGQLRPSNLGASARAQPVLDTSTTRAQVLSELMAEREGVSSRGSASGARKP